MAKEIQAVMVLEILGRPAEHIKSALSELVSKLSSEKGIKVIDKVVHEPVAVKDSEDIYTTFAEVTIEFESMNSYFGIIFAYMPAHIEIISPSSFSLTNVQFNELGNKLLARLHDYDAIAKRIIAERNFAIGKLREVAPQLFKNAPQPAPQPAPAEVKEKKSKSPKKKAKKK
ncbi:MAG: hypothetical protein MUF61_00100 [archaeon]|nr:hypothetical protein [archaeon]